MYTISCNGYPILDTRDESYIVTNPRVRLANNTVGEGSFRIYADHPHYNQLTMFKSIFEVADEFGVIFRGFMTENTRDFDNGKEVDLEGVLSFFNDSIVRPYKFPDDFLDDEWYKQYSTQPEFNIVRAYLLWLINNHNSQVQPHQQFKLGNVTVGDPNNYITREDSEYPSTWKVISDKLFNSNLGGYICIRYEADGNYIDYLAEFTEVNAQGIVYGQNLIDIARHEDGVTTYSAIIPRGATIEGTDTRLTIEGITDSTTFGDLVREGDTLYSKTAVELYGWRYAPIEDTTWDDITLADNLLTKGIEYLNNVVVAIPNTIEVQAVDLHAADAQIESLRMYKRIPIYTPAHGISDTFELTSLDIDLLNPQNTTIVAGKTVMTLTEQQRSWQKTTGVYVTALQMQNAISASERKNQSIYAPVGTVITKVIDPETQKMLDDPATIIYQINNSQEKVRLGRNRLTMQSDNCTIAEDGTMSTVNTTLTSVKALSGKIGDWYLDKPTQMQQFYAGTVLYSGAFSAADGTQTTVYLTPEKVYIGIRDSLGNVTMDSASWADIVRIVHWVKENQDKLRALL